MNDITELVIILDRSGSMQPLTSDVIGGYNALIEEQKKEGDVRVTTIFFNDKVEFIHQQSDIHSIAPLMGKDYVASGTTALLDAVGEAIAFIKAKQVGLATEEQPKNTIFSIMTDGMENASKEYTYSQIKDLIETQKKQGWEFLFQAANIDVAKESNRLGIDPRNAMSFKATSEGVAYQMRCASAMISKAKVRENKE